MTKMIDQKSPSEFKRLLEILLFDAYGPILREKELATLLGYESSEGLREAYESGEIDIPWFKLDHRRDRFILVYEVAGWLSVHWRRQLEGDDRLS